MAANLGNAALVERDPLQVSMECDAHDIGLERPIILTQHETPASVDSPQSQMSTSLYKYLQIIRNSKTWREAKHLVLQKWFIEYHHLVISLMDQFADMNINVRFWDLYTNNITTLTLKGCTFPSSGIDYHLLPPYMMRAVPNLERLSLVDCQYGAICEDTDQEEGKEPHKKIISLCIENLRDANGDLVYIHNANGLFTAMFPELKSLCLRHQYAVESNALVLEDVGPAFRSLTHLEIMESCNFAYTTFTNHAMRSTNGWVKKLEKLSIDVGMYFEQVYVEKLLSFLSESLRELHLYRAPNFYAWSSFDNSVNFPNLKELHLWGNVCTNLCFLGLMPQLEVLTWKTSCYEDAEHGARLHYLMKHSDFIFHCLFNGTLVTKTESLENDCILVKLTTLEMDWGPITANCWRKLGEWFPNLRKLKGTVEGNVEFCTIGKVWRNIEHLELAHGSGVTADGIYEAFIKRSLFRRLTTFTWKPCACFVQKYKYENREELEKQMRVGEVLVRRVSEKVILPWGDATQEETTGLCPHELFLNILLYNGFLTEAQEFEKAQFLSIFGSKRIRIPVEDSAVEGVQMLMENVI